MSVRTSRLSRAKEAEHAYYLREMQSEGLDLEIPEEWEERARVLDIVVAGPAESTVFETTTGGVAYAVRIRAVAVRSGVILAAWGLSTDYDHQIEPESFDEGSSVCRLGGQEFSPREVLNSRIEKNLVLRRGQVVEGWLLATGITPIPAGYRNFSVVPFQLTFWDQLGNEFQTPGNLSVLRTAQRHRTNRRRGTGLYGLDDTGKPRELSLEEESGLRYRELVRQERARRATEVATGSTSRS